MGKCYDLSDSDKGPIVMLDDYDKAFPIQQVRVSPACNSQSLSKVFHGRISNESVKGAMGAQSLLKYTTNQKSGHT